MRLKNVVFAAVFVLLAAGIQQAAAQYDFWGRKSVVVLTSLSEVPGTTIAPGTYVFKLTSYDSERKQIDVMNEDESQHLATFLALPDHRLKPDDDTVLLFFEKVPDAAKPIQTWFAAGESDGYEFIYPRARAKEIARSTSDHVLASDSKESEIVAITSNGTEVSLLEPAASMSKKADAANDTVREKPRSSKSSDSKPARLKRKR